MTRHPTARRVHRQDSAPDDVFVARVLETSAWAKQNSRMLVIGGIAAAVVISGLLYFVTSRRAEHAQAAAQLTQVRAVALSGNSQLAIRELEQFLARFGGTPSADEARLMLGSAYLEAGQVQQAQDAVQPLARNLRSGLGMNAALLLAGAHETAQEPHRAEEIYLRMASDARFLFQRQDALDNAARIRLQRGDAAGAAELYQRLLDITPASNTERPIFELRLGEAQTLAATGGTSSAAVPPAPSPATMPSGAAPAEPEPSTPTTTVQ
jgi:predicted negative regulator of RcsB-dependent stress response